MSGARSNSILLHPRRGDSSGVPMRVTPARAGWEFISFAIRRLASGETWTAASAGHELCLVLLAGTCRVECTTRRSGSITGVLGPRLSVFEAYPHAVYVPRRSTVTVTALTSSEMADGRAPARSDHPPAIIGPQDCGFEIRGGGNATRQIIDILPPQFAADRLMVCEVLTPSGNWSSYPPHKHDLERPPVEADLEEIYYFKFHRPEGYGIHRVYTSDGRRDETMVVRDGDLVIVREGYHPFVAAYGYDAYYLNVLAGNRRSMAASDDPNHAKFRTTWPAPDPRLPLVARPTGKHSR